MNKLILKIFFGIFLLLCHNSLFAAATNKFEVRAAAFYPSDSLFRNIYGNVGVDYQLQAASKITNSFDAWTNLDWFPKHGRSLGFNNRTNLDILNLSLGINFLYYLNFQNVLYAGLGPSVARIWIEDHSECGEVFKYNKTAIGGVFKIGFYRQLKEWLFIDLFVDYLYQPVKFDTSTVNFGGLKPGVGLGINF